MKRCPVCNREYTNETLRFCLEDGTPLPDSQNQIAPTLTMPPPTLAYVPAMANETPPPPTQTGQPKAKRKLRFWLLGGFVLIFVLCFAFVFLLFRHAILGTSDDSSNANNANRVAFSDNSNANQKAESTPVSSPTSSSPPGPASTPLVTPTSSNVETANPAEVDAGTFAVSVRGGSRQGQYINLGLAIRNKTTEEILLAIDDGARPVLIDEETGVSMQTRAYSEVAGIAMGVQTAGDLTRIGPNAVVNFSLKFLSAESTSRRFSLTLHFVSLKKDKVNKPTVSLGLTLKDN